MAEETFAERLWEAIDETLEGYDLPSEFGGMLKKDLKDAFDARGAPRPGYEPGAVGRFRFNLVDAVTQPGKTAWKTVSTVFSERSRPSLPLAWTDAEKDVWQKLFIDSTIGGWVDATGNPVVPSSLRQATLRWNEGARTRVTRLVREQRAIFENPGLTLMMAKQLNYYYASLPGAPAPIVAGVMLPSIIQEAKQAEMETTHALALADAAEKVGDHAEAVKKWGEATERQKQWAKDPKDYQDPVRKEFERVSRMGSQKNAPQAAHALANSQEAKFWRYWKNRRLYFQTLNFLNTYKEKGFWGTAKVYAWDEFTKRAFAKGTWRENLYPANFIQNKIVQPFAKKIRLTKLLDKLTDWRSRFAGFWKRVVYERVKGWIVKIGAKLGLKVLMAKIGALLGSVAPGAGTAVGAIIGAVASFVVGIVSEKAIMPALKGILYLFAGSCAILALVIGGAAIGLPLLMASIFAPGAGGPGAGPPPLPPVYRVTVKKESCLKRIIAGVETWDCQTRSKINNDTGVREIKWQITIENKSDQTAQVVISDTECEETWRYTSDGEGFLNPGDKRIPNCIKNYDTNDLALHNSTVYNTVTGTAWVGSESRDLYAVGMLVIGAPPDAPPCGYPAGTAMSVTSHFMATDVCRRYDRWCGTLPMEGCSVGEVNDVTGIHSGLDLDSNFDGQPLYSTINGTVMHIQSGGGSDWAYITVCNASWCILYGHTFRSFPVSVGDTVTVGEHIAWLGSTGDVTGPHVHYMVWDRLLPAILTWGNFADCAPNCCVSPLHNPANFLGPCD